VSRICNAFLRPSLRPASDASCRRRSITESKADSRSCYATTHSQSLSNTRSLELITIKLPSGVQANPRPGTVLSQRTVHSSFDCSQPFCSPFCCLWRFVCTQDKATARQPGILCGWSGRLQQSPTAHSFRTYIINVQKHAQGTSFFTFLRH